MADRQKLDRPGLLHLLVVYLVWGSTYLAIRVAVREGAGFPALHHGLHAGGGRVGHPADLGAAQEGTDPLDPRTNSSSCSAAAFCCGSAATAW